MASVTLPIGPLFFFFFLSCVFVRRGGERDTLWRRARNVLTGRQKVFKNRHGGGTAVGWRGGALTGGTETCGEAGGGAVGVIVSSSPASAANCLDECRAVAAGQQMNGGCVRAGWRPRVRARGVRNTRNREGRAEGPGTGK